MVHVARVKVSKGGISNSYTMGFPPVRHARVQRVGGTAGPDTPSILKNHKNRASKQYWSGCPEKLKSYQARIQCWGIIGTPAKRHLNGVSLAGR